MQMTSIQTRVPKNMKDQVAKILKRLGLDFSTLNRMLYAQIIEKKKLPFDVSIEMHTEQSLDRTTEAEVLMTMQQTAILDSEKYLEPPLEEEINYYEQLPEYDNVM